MKFINTLFAAALLLVSTPMLAGCAGLAGLASAPPAPLAATQIDDNAVKVGFRAADLALDAVNKLIDVGLIVPGSAHANALADGIEVVVAALNAADEARQAGQSLSYAAAMANVREAFNELRVLFAKAT